MKAITEHTHSAIIAIVIAVCVIVLGVGLFIAFGHQHNWVVQAQTVHHEQQVKAMAVCDVCDEEISEERDRKAIEAHVRAHAKTGQSDTYHIELKVVAESYDETVATGYVCSGCGATK